MSKFIIGSDRSQIPLFAYSMEQAIAQDNQVRLIDLFVDRLELADFGFDFTFVENGRPAYHPADLLKNFIYGYLNRMRCSGFGERMRSEYRTYLAHEKLGSRSQYHCQFQKRQS
ncbi:hypothetical protein BJQ96_03102 [Flavobacterium sp. PL0002]|nr:hypothetical protein [Flavobacterium sp. PL002]